MNIINDLNNVQSLLHRPSLVSISEAEKIVESLIDNINLTTSESTDVVAIDKFEYKLLLEDRITLFKSIIESSIEKLTTDQAELIINQSLQQLTQLK